MPAARSHAHDFGYKATLLTLQSLRTEYGLPVYPSSAGELTSVFEFLPEYNTYIRALYSKNERKSSAMI